MSIVVIATALPLPEHRAEVVAEFEDAIGRVHDEAGVEVYALHESPDRLVMIEKYASAEAQAAHVRGAALAELMAAVNGKLASPLDVQVLTPHPVGDPRKGAL